jgi:hypothetical protein
LGYTTQEHAVFKKGKHLFTLCNAERLPRRQEIQQTQIQLVVQLQFAQTIAGYFTFKNTGIIHKEMTVLDSTEHLRGFVVHERPQRVDY